MGELGLSQNELQELGIPLGSRIKLTKEIAKFKVIPKYTVKEDS